LRLISKIEKSKFIMIRILVNDGIHPDGKLLLEEAGYDVVTDKIAQEDLATELPKFDAIVIRSATKVRQDLIDKCPNLKIIARGGVGLDNVDVTYAREKGIEVMNTPAASSQSVAELAFAHMFSIARFLHLANRDMPAKGDSEFKNLKKSYSKGFQLRGKTLGIIGFGRIGQESARIGIGMGMKVMPVDLVVNNVDIGLNVYKSADVSLTVNVETVKMNQMLAKADIITLHVPGGKKPLIGKEEFEKMKEGVVVINTARGGTINEAALLEALDSGKVRAAGLDVFENEPTPRKEILEHSRISLSPHIGASTGEAQRNIGLELADKIIAFFGS
jgi:D-3-phosphoglycerate dehydrogenase